MRTTVQLRVTVPPASLLRELTAIRPSTALSRFSYHYDADLADPILKKMERTLAERGYSRWPGTRDRNRHTEYSVNYIREYDESDWEKMEFLELHYESDEELDDGFGEGETVRTIGGKDIIDGRDFYGTFMNAMVVPDRSRKLLGPSKLIGLTFAPVIVDPDDGNPFNASRPPRVMPIEGMPFWEVVPTIKLPPLSPTMALTDTKLNPLPPGDEAAFYKVTEWPYNHAELHFRRDDMASMPQFDVARTREHFGVTPRTVISRRFYRACVEIGLRGNWVPVHLDD